MPHKVLTARFAPALGAAMIMIMVLVVPMTARAAAGLERAVAATMIVLGEDHRPLGSAVLLEGGLAITTADVVGARAAVDLRDGTGRTVRAQVVARDGRRGIALLRVPVDFGPGLALAPVTVPVGQAVYAIGAPLGMAPMVTRGIIAAPPRQPDPAVALNALRHDAVVHDGVAGGPLVDEQGRLLGLNRAAPDGALIGLGWAVSASDLARIVPLMVAGDLRDVPDLGLSLRRVTPDIAEALGLTPGGLLVETVIPRSRAARAGLQAGDIVLGYNATVLEQVGALAFLIEARQEDTARLHIRRGASLLTVTLNLAPVTGQLATLSVSGGAVARIESYRFATLGVMFEDAGRVSHVSLHSPAFVAGLQPGDTVLALNGTPIDRAGLEALVITKPILLLIARNGATQHVLINPWGSAPRTAVQQRANLLDARAHLF
ncbi:S1C family serine protease [Oceaniglobus ichthyenteri]|uniref:S1C family serine protease n=1 Tax=Oceaniglobus ichthyenteri TaxID=2136177 RepID=UPI000D369325|nr:trypsin-like peptidase domain-containing protein [Oceaniglobus ichthyenteri]